MTGDRYRVCFLFNAQLHQVVHGVATAVALARISDFEVSIISPQSENIDLARDIAKALGGAPIHFEVRRSLGLRLIHRITGRKDGTKKLTLRIIREHLERFDAIALPERTSTVLKRMGLARPLYIHLDHGAGDGAAGYDKRIALFDFVLLAGSKQRERMARDRLITEGHYKIVGYPKFEAADAIRDGGWSPFSDERPTVLYTPHHSSLGSWRRFGRDVLRSFAEQQEFNLIFAPHIRLFAKGGPSSSDAELLSWAAQQPHIHVDLGSRRSADMTYTELADIYLGDVSSQVYEFIRRPRPCLFLNAHGVNWPEDENYAHWRFGPVLESTTGLVDALRTAQATHAEFAAVQRLEFAQTFASGPASPSSRAAGVIANYVRKTVLRPSMIARAMRGRAFAEFQSQPQRRSARHGLRQAAAVLLLVAAGWLGRSVTFGAAQAPMSFAQEADELHDAVVSFQGNAEPRDFQALARKSDIALPSIPAGWRVTSASLISSELGPMILLTAVAPNGVRLTIVASSVASPGENALVLTNVESDSIASWSHGGRSYAVVGRTPQDLVRRLAADLYSSQRTS